MINMQSYQQNKQTACTKRRKWQQRDRKTFKNQNEMLGIKSTLLEMKNNFERLKSRFKITEGEISEPGDRSMETSQMETQM